MEGEEVRPLVVLFALLTIVTACSSAPATAQENASATIVGSWECNWKVESGALSGKDGTITLVIASSKDERASGSLQLTGLAHDVDGPVTGKINGADVTLQRWPLPYGTLVLYLTLSGNTLTGSFSYGSMSNHQVSCKRMK